MEMQGTGEEWACVEIFGHRRYYGRIHEVEQYGSKMIRIDVPREAPDQFESFFYGGAGFIITPLTEEAARQWAERTRPKAYAPRAALPPPQVDGDEEPGDTDDGLI